MKTRAEKKSARILLKVSYRSSSTGKVIVSRRVRIKLNDLSDQEFETLVGIIDRHAYSYNKSNPK